MSVWSWPDPFRLVPIDLLPIPSGYAFLFNPIPSIGIVVGIYYILGRRKRSAKALIPLFILLLVTLTGAGFFAQKHTLVYEPGQGCPLVEDKQYIAVKPLFVPGHVRMLMPDRGQFDAITCDQFVEKMQEEAMLGWIATLSILALLLAVASFCLGAIFSWPLKALQKPKLE